MEDSSVLAKYVYQCEDNEIDEYNHGFTNVSELSKHVTNYNFGDLVTFSDYRDTGTYIVGKDGKLIGSWIAYHLKTTLNWGLTAALGAILLGFMLIFYWLYNKIVGIDNIKLG